MRKCCRGGKMSHILWKEQAENDMNENPWPCSKNEIEKGEIVFMQLQQHCNSLPTQLIIPWEKEVAFWRQNGKAWNLSYHTDVNQIEASVKINNNEIFRIKTVWEVFIICWEK